VPAKTVEEVEDSDFERCGLAHHTIIVIACGEHGEFLAQIVGALLTTRSSASSTFWVTKSLESAMLEPLGDVVVSLRDSGMSGA
jgi:hypothetical protein